MAQPRENHYFMSEFPSTPSENMTAEVYSNTNGAAKPCCRLDLSIDGACRNSGRPGAAGTAAVVSGPAQSIITVRCLPHDPVPTNQRVELCGVILALHEALVYDMSDPESVIDVTVRTNSKYVYGCMTEWMSKWLLNGWLNAKGHPVANKDLPENTRQRQKQVGRNGRVTYLWVPREQN